MAERQSHTFFVALALSVYSNAFMTSLNSRYRSTNEIVGDTLNDGALVWSGETLPIDSTNTRRIKIQKTVVTLDTRDGIVSRIDGPVNFFSFV